MCKSNNCVVHWDALSPKTWPNKAKPKTTWFNLMEKPTWNCEVRFLWSDPLWQLRWWLATNCKQQPYTPDVHLMLQYVPHGLMDANNLDLHLQTQTHKNKQTNNQPNQTKQNKTNKQNKQTKQANEKTNKKTKTTHTHTHTHTHTAHRVRDLLLCLKTLWWRWQSPHFHITRKSECLQWCQLHSIPWHPLYAFNLKQN